MNIIEISSNNANKRAGQQSTQYDVIESLNIVLFKLLFVWPILEILENVQVALSV